MSRRRTAGHERSPARATAGKRRERRRKEADLMHDAQKTKAQLLEEVMALRQRVAALEHERDHRTPFPGAPTQATRLQQTSVALQEREAYLRALVEMAVDGILVIDEQGIVEMCNPAVERLFGYTPAEVIGQNVCLLMPSPDREAHDDYLAHYLRTGEKRIIGIGREVLGQRKDGMLIPLRLSVSEILLGTKRFFMGILPDIT